MKDKAIEALEELIEATSTIQNNSTLTSWKNAAKNTIIRIYGMNSDQLNQIQELRFSSGVRVVNPGQSNSIQSGSYNHKQNEVKSLITAFINDIERFGLPDKTDSNSEQGIKINIVQSQNQETKISLHVFVEIIRDELTGSQQKELQQIIDEPELDQSTKKSRIVDKLKNFGGDVASNIIANILTNPNLYNI